MIAVLGEYDPLADLSQAAGVAEPRPAPDNPSGNGHGCGHHLPGAGSLLAAVTAKDYLAAHDLPGRGCATTAAPPKKAAAARPTCMPGAFGDADAALTWHPSDTTQVMSNAVLASIQAYFGSRVRRAGLRRVAGVHMTCGGTGRAGIGQLADGRGGRGRDDGGMEIRIVLDRAEPPAGRLRVIGAPSHAHRGKARREICFTGWLGLLRALYEVTAEPGQGAGPGS